MRKLDKASIKNIATGASFMGAGGGGDPYIGRLMATAALKQGNEITLQSVDEIDPNAIYVPVACMGAPSVMSEFFPKGDEFKRLLDVMQNHLGKEIKGTFPIEAGGVNSLIPLVVAAQTGLPVVDCDSMGRAFPELQMTTLHLAGVSVTPMILTDALGNLSVLDTVTDHWAERLARDLTVELGATANVAQYATTGKKLADNSIHGIVTKCEKIGEIVSQHAKGTDWQNDQIIDITGGYHVFDGKVVDVSEQNSGGFNHGEIKVDGLDNYHDSTLKIEFQNENLVAYVDNQLIGSVPDLICFADKESLTPMTAEDIKYGKRISVYELPCDDKWRTPEGIKTVGPRYFGFDFDYKPVEQLLKEAK